MSSPKESLKTIDNFEKKENSLSADEENSSALDSWRSWVVVVGSFLIVFNNFGQTYQWGVYQEHYIKYEFSGQANTQTISYIGTTSNAFMFVIGPFIGLVLQKIGFRGSMVLGTILCPLALLLASFNTALWQLYLTQGVMFGFGNAFVFFPSMLLPNQWFNKYRGLATGIAVSGSGIGGLCLTPLARYIMENLGYRWCLRVNAMTCLVLLSIATILCRPRISPPKKTWKSMKLFDRKLISFRLVLMFCYGTFACFG
ncbi:uncharacterized protein VTP21DRAFT_4282 [Calcarisporiella thermophila]|uniref:uncharacterized protein n=1 Tax=Calcarisporiella thermophila TaxID=911321 RepID=UPI003741FAED